MLAVVRQHLEVRESMARGGKWWGMAPGMAASLISCSAAAQMMPAPDLGPLRGSQCQVHAFRPALGLASATLRGRHVMFPWQLHTEWEQVGRA